MTEHTRRLSEGREEKNDQVENERRVIVIYSADMKTIIREHCK